MHLWGAGWVAVFLVWFFIACGRGEDVQVVKIGALLSFNSSIGTGVLASLRLAVHDVNANTSILPGVQLELQSLDTSCNIFQGAAAAVELLKGDVVAIAGPQTSIVAMFAADLGAATQVPIVSFSATDPSLTESRNPFFLRTIHNDAVGMSALAAIVGLYGWRAVAAVSTNDYDGLNAVDAIFEALVPIGVTLAQKSTFSPDISVSEMANVLTSLSLGEARVFVVHLQPSIARLFFSTAHLLSMVTTGYVWIVSEALTGTLDELTINDPLWAVTQGVIGIRTYLPPSSQLNSFSQRWKAQQGAAGPPADSFGMLAYDTVWMIAHAMNTWLLQGENFTFRARTTFSTTAGGGTDLASLKVLDNGERFLDVLKRTQFAGVTGPIELDEKGDLVGASYEIVNFIGKSGRVVGYWNVSSGFSLQPGPGSNLTLSKTTPSLSQLEDVIWPGGSASVPRGWSVAKNGQRLMIGVPHKSGFPEFVNIQTDSATNITSYHGFCIDVFEAAVSYLPYLLNYTFVPFGNGTFTPSYNSLIDQIPAKVFDGVVGDVIITTQRSKLVDFTQPYTEAGFVVLVPTETEGSGQAWAFMRPFTPLMWCTTALFFLFTGLVVWILEHKKNRDFRGKPKKQLVTVLWFIFSTLFFSQREKTKSIMGRAVLLIWLFVVLIVISSYTASLTSILTVQQLRPVVQGIVGLVSSNLVIGFQQGSFLEKYLLQMNVPQDRLVPLGNQTEFADALAKGRVGAIVDELPYIQVFQTSECSYAISGQEFLKSGWGFAFPKGSPLAVDLSTAILQLVENGQLQQIHDFWVNNDACKSTALQVDSNELALGSFWGLFLITGTCSVVCVLLYYSRLILQHYKTWRDGESDLEERSMSRRARQKSFLRSLVNYLDESEVVGKDGELEQKKDRKRSGSDRESGRESGRESAGGSGRFEEPSRSVLEEDRDNNH